TVPRDDQGSQGGEPGADFRCPTDIYTADADGGNVTRLTADPASEYQPQWSPDGSRIAFVQAFNGTATAIYVMETDGTGVRQVSSAVGGSDFSPSWSPDGKQIVFAAIRNEDWGIWVVNADGPDEHRTVSGVEYGFGSMWVSSFDKSQTGWITRLDTTTGEKVARISTGDVFPTWEIGGGGLTVGNGSLWLAGAAAAPGEIGGVHAFLLRIDPDTNAVVARIDLGTGSGADGDAGDRGLC